VMPVVNGVPVVDGLEKGRVLASKTCVFKALVSSAYASPLFPSLSPRLHRVQFITANAPTSSPLKHFGSLPILPSSRARGRGRPP
jgi:hypothetical protein